MDSLHSHVPSAKRAKPLLWMVLLLYEMSMLLFSGLLTTRRLACKCDMMSGLMLAGIVKSISMPRLSLSLVEEGTCCASVVVAVPLLRRLLFLNASTCLLACLDCAIS